MDLYPAKNMHDSDNPLKDCGLSVHCGLGCNRLLCVY